ncbi:MAG: nucleotidyltransferase domain-containing protein [Hallerella porci]|uniref:nucleotidyltransferase family protein n=1 Tax=Hallerella TaxID=2815788 RepID=UPI001304CB4A|nr:MULTISPECIES: nucleotidyltransferase domain-containing protein [Hallerella]MCI5600113.1 nucleotidyltransferase domain-containing protein [Hallerella sp.]MDY3920543.1 nucleotidyltransferase domain-containing protein [Hallerella porci]
MTAKMQITPTALGISEKSMAILLQILNAQPHICYAKIFGSREKGNYKEGSDIDLCLFVDNEFPIKNKLHMMRAFEESSLPYKVDLLIFSELQNENLKEHIELVGKTIYERAN